VVIKGLCNACPKGASNLFSNSKRPLRHMTWHSPENPRLERQNTINLSTKFRKWTEYYLHKEINDAQQLEAERCS